MSFKEELARSQGPIRYQQAEEHPLFILDDLLPALNTNKSLYEHSLRVSLPGFPDLFVNYVATRSNQGFDVSCSIIPTNLIAANLIHFETQPNGNHMNGKFANIGLECMFARLRHKIEVSSESFLGVPSLGMINEKNQIPYIYSPIGEKTISDGPKISIEHEKLFTTNGIFFLES